MATLIVEITHRCPCNCPNCPIPEETKRHGKIMGITEFAEILRFFSNVWKGEKKYLIISGGEPSIVPNLEYYVSVAHMQNYIVTIVSNAYNPANLEKSKADLFEISIDYANPIKHDTYRGVHGLWSRAMSFAWTHKNSVVRSTWFGDNTEDILWLAKVFKGRTKVYCMPCVFYQDNTYYKLKMDLVTRFRLKRAGVVLAKECDHSRFATVDPYGNLLVCPFVRINMGKLSEEALMKLFNLNGCPAKKVKVNKYKVKLNNSVW